MLSVVVTEWMSITYTISEIEYFTFIHSMGILPGEDIPVNEQSLLAEMGDSNALSFTGMTMYTCIIDVGTSLLKYHVTRLLYILLCIFSIRSRRDFIGKQTTPC